MYDCTHKYSDGERFYHLFVSRQRVFPSKEKISKTRSLILVVPVYYTEQKYKDFLHYLVL